MIAKDGIPIIIGTGIIVAILAAIAFMFNLVIVHVLALLLTGLFIFHFFFFRDPERKTPQGDKLIISPADGTIINIDEVEENEYHNTRVKRVSIFMSVFNVHVNRMPVSGKVEKVDYAKGKFLAAFDKTAAEVNERTIIGIQSAHGKLMFKQIAGLIARRIVYHVKPGDDVHTGNRFGLIRYGSRVDLYFPLSAKINVKLKEKVRSGSTIIGEF